MISIRNARKAGVPLVVIETADPRQTIDTIIKNDLNGKADQVPLMVWDIVRALAPLNAKGEAAIGKLVGNDSPQIATGNPVQCLGLLEKVAADSIIFFMNAHRYWEQETVMQAMWNLRDVFKSEGTMLVMLCASSGTLPTELKNDTVVLTDELPTEEEITAVVDSIAKAAKMEQIEDKGKVIDTLTGLSAFAAEQVFAMSIDAKEKKVDQQGLWERKRKTIEQTPGLSVWRGGETFNDIGGYENVKSFLRAICTGQKPPKCIIFIDEIEKSIAGAGTDTSGVSQDQLRTLLTFMQDENASGIIMVGPPGSGKSAVAKGAGNEAGIPTIALDLGGMKGSLVGESERRLRSALQVAKAVSQGEILFLATCNATGVLPPELKRRFSLGTFYFELPDDDARIKIWNIYLKKLGLFKQAKPDDAGWTGAEIKNCCTIAWRLNISLVEAAKFIVPVSVSSADQIERLAKESHRKYISASKPGIFEYDKLTQTTNKTRRVIE
jgi:hypothetical protein